MKKVLIVDDEMLIALNTKIILEENKYDAITANSGEIAISLIEGGNIPDLILMDIDLGKGRIDGVEATRKIIEKHDIPVVFHSGHTDKETIEKTKSVTKYGYVHKTSMNEMYLLSSIDMALNLHETNSKLVESEEKYSNMIQNSSNMTMLQKPDGVVEFISSPAEDVIGHKLDKFIGTDFPEYIHPDDKERVFQTWSKALSGEEIVDFEYRFYSDIGEVQWLSHTARPVKHRGNLKGIQSIVRNITERKLAMDEIINAKNELEKFFDLVPDMVCIASTDGYFKRLNKAWTDVLGYTIEELLSKPLKDFIHPDDVEDTFREIEKQLSGGSTANFINRYCGKDGDYRWFEWMATPAKGNLLYAAARDITEHKQIENTLQKSEEKFHSLFNNIRVGVALHEIITDENNKPVDYIFIDVNLEYEKLTQLKQSDIIGKRVLEVIPNLEQKWIDIYGKVAQTGEPITFIDHTEFLDKYWEVRAYSPKKNQFVVAFTDITERMQAEQEIKRQLSEKEIILKEVHHRIKNNFTSIGSLLNLQANSVNNPEALSILQDTIGRVNGMSILYERLLLTDNYKTTSVKEYLDNLITDIISLFPGNLKIKVKKQIEDLQLDSKHLFPIGIIVNELLTNIMKYAFIGKNSGLIQITFEERNENAILTIQDDGNGLPEGFDLGTQQGFGLMLVDLYSQQLDGSFSIDSNDGTKSTLEFTI